MTGDRDVLRMAMRDSRDAQRMTSNGRSASPPTAGEIRLAPGVSPGTREGSRGIQPAHGGRHKAGPGREPGINSRPGLPHGDHTAMRHTYSAIHLHVVFAVHERQPLLTDVIRGPLHAYLATICRRQNVVVHAVGGARDHVHLGIGVPPDLEPASLVRDLKSNSSSFIHTNANERFAWQRGYSVFSVSASVVPQLIRYIERQMEHHRKRSFHEEIEDLLQKYGLRLSPG